MRRPASSVVRAFFSTSGLGGRLAACPPLNSAEKSHICCGSPAVEANSGSLMMNPSSRRSRIRWVQTRLVGAG